MTKIAVFVGSLRKNSINQQLAYELEKILPEGVTFDYANLDLPLYNADLEAEYPTEARNLKERVEAADGILFVTPEHNRSFTAVMKNAIDWVSRPWGTNSFNGKPVAIAGVSSSLATSVAQQQLRTVLLYLNTKVMGQPEMYVDHQRVYDEEGNLTPEAVERYKAFLDAFISHVNG